MEREWLSVAREFATEVSELGMVKIIFLILILILPIISVGAYYSRISLDWADTNLTNLELDKTLAEFEWTTPYKKDSFDCSNMSQILSGVLEEKGFHTRIATNFRHMWLLVKTKEGIQEVEATVPSRGYDMDTPMLVIYPQLTVLVGFTSEFKGFGLNYAQGIPSKQVVVIATPVSITYGD
jgi:hypothetical protein